MKRIEYALYKEDKFLCIGTLKEIAEFIGVTYETIRTYKTRRKDYIFVKLDDEELFDKSEDYYFLKYGDDNE